MNASIARTAAISIVVIWAAAAAPRARTQSTPPSTVERAVAAYVDAHNAEALALLERVVNINSGTNNVAGVKAVGAVFTQEFARLACTACERDLGELGAWLARAEHEQDSPSLQRVRVAELTKEAGVVERRGFESRASLSGCFDLFCVGAQRDAFAADVELHGLGEAVEEAFEGGDERCLLGRAS